MKPKQSSKSECPKVILEEAIEEVEHWGSYAPEWASRKYDLEGTLGRLRAAVLTVEAIESEANDD